MANFGPYKLWPADLWMCHGCGKKIISGYSQRGIEHHEKDFEVLLEQAKRSGYLYYNYTKGD